HAAHREDHDRRRRRDAAGNVSLKSMSLRNRGFTLLEVMVAIAILGIALLGLMTLHHQSMQSVLRTEDVTKAAMLAQMVMTDAELDRYPDPGDTRGDFAGLFHDRFRNFRWERIVEESGYFPDVRKVRVIVFYGPNLTRAFSLTEYLHSPPPAPGS